MRILIIENEIYLAQSIAAKLSELGHICEICSSTKDALNNDYFDVVLLSTNISGQDIYPVITKYRRSVIILMVSYISNDTVSKPLNMGAKDYILKPFNIEELIRKIKHFQDYKQLKRQNNMYLNYIEYGMRNLNLDFAFEHLHTPLYLISSSQKYSDAFSFKLAQTRRQELIIFEATQSDIVKKLTTIDQNAILYITNVQQLNENQFEQLRIKLSDFDVIYTSTDDYLNKSLDCIELHNEHQLIERGEILPIEEYVKFIVLNYQNQYPDTELSKRLGISRKSLWEKRKKYGILKNR